MPHKDLMVQIIRAVLLVVALVVVGVLVVEVVQQDQHLTLVVEEVAVVRRDIVLLQVEL